VGRISHSGLGTFFKQWMIKSTTRDSVITALREPRSEKALDDPLCAAALVGRTDNISAQATPISMSMSCSWFDVVLLQTAPGVSAHSANSTVSPSAIVGCVSTASRKAV
jgi:hypothetical protein